MLLPLDLSCGNPSVRGGSNRWTLRKRHERADRPTRWASPAIGFDAPARGLRVDGVHPGERRPTWYRANGMDLLLEDDFLKTNPGVCRFDVGLFPGRESSMPQMSARMSLFERRVPNYWILRCAPLSHPLTGWDSAFWSSWCMTRPFGLEGLRYSV